MKTLCCLLLAGAGLGLGAWAGPTNTLPTAATLGSMASLDNRQKLGAGDKISYRVLEDQEEVRVLTLTDAGELDVPYLGLLPAAGKTSLQLAQEVKAALEKKLYQRATVLVALQEANRKRVSGKVYVSGNVRTSGAYDITGDNFTVSKAILSAGGFSDFANKKKVQLIRKTARGTKVFTVDVRAIWEKGQVDQDLAIEPEDQVHVTQKIFND